MKNFKNQKNFIAYKFERKKFKLKKNFSEYKKSFISKLDISIIFVSVDCVVDIKMYG